MVDLQSSNRVAIAKVRETTFGVTPATPAFKKQRVTSHSLALNPQATASNEIRSDRQLADEILTSYQAGGTVGREASFQTLDDDLEEALQGTWAANPNILNSAGTQITALSTTTATVGTGLGTPFVAGMIALTGGFAGAANDGILPRVASSGSTTVVFPASTFVVDAAPATTAFLRVVGFQGASADLVLDATNGNHMTSTALDFTTLGLQAGMWLKLGGALTANQFATAADNDFVRISAIVAHTLTFDRVPTGWTADAGTGKTPQVFMGDFLTNGSTKRSNTFERQYLDHSPVTYEYLRGFMLDKMAFTVKAAAIATVSNDYIGNDAVTQTSRFAGATDVSAPTNDVLNAATNVGRLGFDGSVVASPDFVLDATWTYANNLRRQQGVGSLGAIGIGDGEFNVSGSLDFYFGDKTVLDKIMNNTLTSFDCRLGRTDSNNESYVFDFPAIKLSSGSPSVSGKNSDVMINAGFQAILSVTYGYTASVGRFYFLP